MLGSWRQLALLGKSPVDGGTDCIVSFRIERMPHVVREDDIPTRIGAELELKSPMDWDEGVPSPMHHSQGTCDPISQGPRWIGSCPSRTDPDAHFLAGDPPAWPRAHKSDCQERPESQRDPPLGGTRNDNNSGQLGVVAGVAENGDAAERRADEDRRNSPSQRPRCGRLDIEVLQMSQCVGPRRSSVAAGVVGEDLEVAVVQSPGKCFEVGMILSRRQSVYEHNGGLGSGMRRWPVEAGQSNSVACQEVD